MAFADVVNDMVKMNVTYDLGNKDPAEAAKMVKQALKKVLQSRKFADMSMENAQIDAPVVGEKWQIDLETDSWEGAPKCAILVLCGVKSDEKPIVLNQESSLNKSVEPFRNNQTDSFEIFVDDDVGDIFKLRFGFPASTSSAKWNIKYLKLWQPKTGDTFRCPCDLEITASPYVDCWREVYVAWPDFPVLKELE